MLNYQRVHTIIGESLYTGYWYFTVKMDDHPRLGTLDQTFEHGMCIFCVRFRAKKLRCNVVSLSLSGKVTTAEIKSILIY